jgi:hypothetical protein
LTGSLTYTPLTDETRVPEERVYRFVLEEHPRLSDKILLQKP